MASRRVRRQPNPLFQSTIVRNTHLPLMTRAIPFVLWSWQRRNTAWRTPRRTFRSIWRSVTITTNWRKTFFALCYRIRNRACGDFEIEGVSDALCEWFSKRHEQIDDAQAALLRTKPELADANQNDLRAHLATAERARKIREQRTTRRQPSQDASTTSLSDTPVPSSLRSHSFAAQRFRARLPLRR
jgi:membrane carboxypeptidase/penicillin-binding protein PbpC